MQMSKFLTVSAAAKLLGVSPNKVRSWITSGELVAVDVGSGSVRPRWRIASDDLQTTLDARKTCDAVAV